MKPGRILTVCAGNICRSPVAEALLRRDLPGSLVGSAGLAALVGHPADPTTTAVALGRGLDLSAHRARQLDEPLLREADLVLTASNAQREAIERRWPWTRGRVWRIGHWEKLDVVDPFQRDPAIFEQVQAVLEACVRNWVSRLG